MGIGNFKFVFEDFKNLKGLSRFLRENVLSPEGRCVAYPVGVQLIFLLTLICLSKRTFKKKKSHRSSVIFADFFPRKVLLLDGRTDCDQKCPLFFFILRYIQHYTYIYLNIYIKNVLTNFLWVLNFGQVGELPH